MLCYKDMTFCTAECITFECTRNKINVDTDHAKEIGLPIAWSDFSDMCEAYKPVGTLRSSYE